MFNGVMLPRRVFAKGMPRVRCALSLSAERHTLRFIRTNLCNVRGSEVIVSQKREKASGLDNRYPKINNGGIGITLPEETMKKKDESEEDKTKRGITRRQFLTTMGVGTAAVAVSGKRAAQAAEEEAVIKAGEMTRVSLNINGRRHRLTVEPRWSLLFVLRERLGLTGTKAGCERGECGACTVLLDGQPRYSCMTLVVEAEGKEITTIEGLMRGEDLGPVQQAFL